MVKPLRIGTKTYQAVRRTEGDVRVTRYFSGKDLKFLSARRADGELTVWRFGPRPLLVQSTLAHPIGSRHGGIVRQFHNLESQASTIQYADGERQTSTPPGSFVP